MKKYIVYIKSLFLLSVVVFLYGFSAERNASRIVENSVVEFSNGANLFLSHEMVNKLLIQKNGEVKNQPKSLINLHDLENAVFQNPLVEDVKIYLTIDGLLKTMIKQRTPIARVNSGKEVYYIDEQGVKMPLSSNYSARVLLVSGEVHEEDLQPIYSLVTKLNSDSFLSKLIVGIQKKSTGDYILQTRKYDQKVFIGKIENLNLKFKKLEAFYNEMIQRNEVATYKTINLKFSNQVVCTKN
ncbi:cell division protein FtsQ/DivIB [Flavicella marina]|uniref:cell division protein FtsQ/DivIB n=1 Tax=Flavicella marina TaxID=1475951 RepID=UPI001264A634|nr:cell division protein FtsQ [Flavicella marina]